MMQEQWKSYKESEVRIYHLIKDATSSCASIVVTEDITCEIVQKVLMVDKDVIISMVRVYLVTPPLSEVAFVRVRRKF